MTKDHKATNPPVVIVVEDDLAVRNSLKFSLELEGFAVLVFETGIELLTFPDPIACACLVIDHKLPGINGMDLIARLRSRRVLAPAVIITTHPGADLKMRAAQAGIPIVEKPLLGTALLDKVHAACARQSNLNA